MPEQVWYLKNLDLFEGLQEISMESIAGHSRDLEWEPRTVVSFQGEATDSVYVILEGRVQLSHLLPDGREVILTHLEPGDFWGAITESGLATSDAGIESHQAVSVRRTRAARFDGHYFRAMLSRRPRIAFKLMKLMGLRKQQIELRLINLCFKSNIQKLASLVLELAENYGDQRPDGIWIRIPLTHQEIGSMVGLTREQVTKLLKQLKEAGGLDVIKGRLLLKDVDILHQMGGQPKGS